MILDTSFLVDVLRGESEVADRLEEIDDSGAAFVSAVTIMELAEGIRLADASDEEQSAVSDLLADLEALPFDRDCALRAGELNANLVTAGKPVDETDVMIAATALVNGYPVLTRDVSHFERIDGLSVRSY